MKREQEQRSKGREEYEAGSDSCFKREDHLRVREGFMKVKTKNAGSPRTERASHPFFGMRASVSGSAR